MVDRVTAVVLQRAAERFDADVHTILIELGQRQMISGQEDMIIGVAAALCRDRESRGTVA